MNEIHVEFFKNPNMDNLVPSALIAISGLSYFS